jgi:heptosyltransferase-2
LRRNYPDAKIDLIVKKEVFPLAENCPYVNRVLYFDVKMNKFFRVLQQYYRMYKIGKKFLWKAHYDLAVIPRWDGDDNYHAFVAYLSSANEIIGYNQENGTEKLLTRKLLKNVIQHEVKQNLAILTYLGGEIKEDKTELWLNDEDKQFANQCIATIRKEDKILVAIAPGAAHPKRMWPKENFADLMTRIYKEQLGKTVFVLLGGRNEKYLGSFLRDKKLCVLDMIGKTTLRQVIALIANCKIFIGHDSGLAHVATAVNSSVVTISCHPVNGDAKSANAPQRFEPWTNHKIVVQPAHALPPCKDKCTSAVAHCITQVQVEEVWEAVNKMLTIGQNKFSGIKE